ncbi:MAG: T9SS type A sorting domain-containing protein [Bacteroidales bacterium]|nr:T9SS type A sorting domain-containing protein [Bacteroidales bacterium]
MKTIISLALGLTLSLTISAQTILTFKSHGLLPNEKNPMVLTKYVDPGTGGQNVVWDFSSLEATNSFTGNVQNSYSLKSINGFEKTNTVLEEFGNYFFFNATNYQLEQYGYISSNGNISIEYTKPFVKMRYPFSFNSTYSGVFEGKYNSNNKPIGDITGNYQVTGDGIGTLILPEKKSFLNALRIKEVKSYKQKINGNTTSIEEITYRWYVNEHRFPILVLINSTYTFENGQNSTSTKAAYNSNIISSNINNINDDNNLKLEVFPNPYHEKVNINLHIDNKSNVKIDVYDIIGKKVAAIADKPEDAGDLTYNFSAKEIGLATGTYIIRVKVNNKETTKKIVEL